MQTPTDPNEVLRQSSEPGQVKVLRLNGPGGWGRYALVRELGPGRALLRSLDDATEVIATATPQGIVTELAPAPGELARREWREVEKPLIKRIRKAHGVLNGFEVANRAMDDARTLLQRKVMEEGGWRPGMQTEVAQMLAHAYLHQPGKEPCDCQPKDGGTVTEHNAAQIADSADAALLQDLASINETLQDQAVDDEEEDAASKLMRRVVDRLAISDEDKARLAEKFGLASAFGALRDDLISINDALQDEAMDDEEQEAAGQLMRRVIDRLAVSDKDRAKLAQELDLIG